MGRAKLKLHKLDGSNRIGVYSRRKKGLLKKANELSILCDINIFLAMFSPGGKSCIYQSENSFEHMIAKFAEVNPEERAKRKIECLETIKKACRKSDNDVNIGEQLCPGDLTMEDINFLSHSLRIRLSDIESRLRLWKNVDKIESIEQLRKMEDSISISLREMARHKYGMSGLEVHPCLYEEQCSSGQHCGLDSSPPGYFEEPCFSVETYTNLVCNKEIEVSSKAEIFLTEYGFTFDVPQVEHQDLGSASHNYDGQDGENMWDESSIRFLEDPFDPSLDCQDATHGWKFQ